jgi:hypothetical protein
MTKKTILLIIISFLASLLLSLLLYWFKARNLTLPLPLIENPTTSTTLITTTTTNLESYLLQKRIEIYNSLKQQVHGIMKIDTSNKITYSFIRNGEANDNGIITKFYDIELKSNKKINITEDKILQIGREIVEKILVIEPNATKINLFFFSDKNLIETSPPDLGCVIWDKENNNFSYYLIPIK